MIWKSVLLMTLFDLAFIFIAGTGIVYIQRFRHNLQRSKGREGFGFITASWGPMSVVLGLSVVGLFYLADLVIMHLLPFISSVPEVMASMVALHLNYSWYAEITGISFILAGVITTGRSVTSVMTEFDDLTSQLIDKEVEIRQLNRELGDRVAQRKSELVRANHTLEESERELWEIVDALPILVSIVGQDGSLYVNNMVSEWGFNRETIEEDFSHIEFYVAGTDDLYPEDQRAFTRALGGEQSHIENIEVLKRDGNRSQLEVWSTPVRDRQGHVYSAVSAVVDITERKCAEDEIRNLNRNLGDRVKRRTEALQQANDALRENEQKLRSIIDTIPVGVTLTGNDGTLQYTNRHTSLLTGMILNSENLEGFLLENIYRAGTDERLTFKQRPEGKALAGEIAHSDDIELALNDGKRILLEVWSSPVFDENHNVDIAVTTIIDISERGRREEEIRQLSRDLTNNVQQRTADLEDTLADLRESEQTVKDIVDAMPIGVLIRQVDGSNYANPKFRELGQRSPDLSESTLEELRKTSLVIRGTDKPYPPDFLPGRRVLSGEKNAHVNDIDLIRKDGVRIPIENWAAPVYDRHGNIKAAVSTIIDISEREMIKTELTKARQEAEIANYNKSTFLSNMSHEIRTPMNAILGSAQILSREANLSGEHKQNLAVITHSGKNLLSLINDILDLSKIEAGYIEIIESQSDLHELIHTIESLFIRRAVAKSLKFSVEIAPDLPAIVSVDEAKLRQIIINLVGNAIKFTTSGYVVVRFSTRISEGQEFLLVSVEDTGPGISARDKEKLFEPFERLSDSLEGTGLGLAISRKYAELMGGEIRLESEPGKGSIFNLILPVLRGTTADLAQDPTAGRITGLAPGQRIPRIIVVDDNRDSARLLQQFLSAMGFEIRVALNGAQAIKVFEVWHPDAILMDRRMPVLDGIAATQHIKDTPEGKATTIIVISASAFDEDRARVLAAGADGFIRKPYLEEEVLKMLGEKLKLNYQYAEELPDQTGTQNEVAEINATQLSGLLPEDVLALRDAILSADLDAFVTLLEKAEKVDNDTIIALQKLARSFDYEKILNLLAPVEDSP